MEDYKVLIDSTELQQKVLDYIGSEEFDKMLDCTVFKDNNQYKLAIIHGMSIASMLTYRCKTILYKTQEKVNEDDNRPQCCKDHDKYFSTCDTCEFGDGE